VSVLGIYIVCDTGRRWLHGERTGLYYSALPLSASARPANGAFLRLSGVTLPIPSRSTTGGCILIDVSPTLVLGATKDAGIAESAKHVWDTYDHADEWTKPEIDTPKKIPGRAEVGYLHREVEGAIPGLTDPDWAPSGTIKNNRAHSISVCKEY
jgi:hypothetical protein